MLPRKNRKERGEEKLAKLTVSETRSKAQKAKRNLEGKSAAEKWVAWTILRREERGMNC